MNTKLLLAATLSCLFLAAPLPLEAQVSLQVRGSGAQFSRADLTELLVRYEEAIESPAYSGDVRESARAGAERIRQRLERGDFRLGDRIALSVRGEPELPDTVAVQTGPLITLPLFGEIDLFGVLRSELEAHLTTALGRFITDPVVEATALTRLSVQGEVTRPGFYVVPADMLLSEALMLAGGPTTGADVDKLRVQRANEDFLQEDEVQAALVEGLTLDQLSLQAGDELILPSEESGSFLAILRDVGLIVVPIVSVIAVLVR